MEIMQQTSPSPNLGGGSGGVGLMMQPRRRKKRVTTTTTTAATTIGGGGLGSSGGMTSASTLTSLNRNGIRLVELTRGKVGYGFTISGQKPCLLRCIVEGSPASGANLHPGNCLVGVNGRDVSHLAHDEVVALIGKCTGLLRLHVTDSYFSESSDEEGDLQITQPRPKYQNNRARVGSKSKRNTTTTTTTTTTTSNSNSDFDSLHHHHHHKTGPRSLSVPLSTPTTTTTTTPSVSTTSLLGEESPIPALPVRTTIRNTTAAAKIGVESVRVFATSQDNKNLYPFPNTSRTSLSNNNNNCRTSRPSIKQQLSQFNHNTNPTTTTSSSPDSYRSSYQAVVGYVGSAEIPAIEERKRLQALTACIRRLRVERRMRSIVLLRIKPNGICLFGSHQNATNGPPLAFYSSGIISFCGAYNEDRRFFGLVTCTSSSATYSCHVFMVDPKLLSHTDHLRRARTFGFTCSSLPLPKYGQVLGLQECVEFPATADPVLSSILRLHGTRDQDEEVRTSQQQQQQQRSPSEASIRLENCTNSSNSDSGVGFRDEFNDRNNSSSTTRIYDIVESEGIMFDQRSPPSRDLTSRSHHHSKITSSPSSGKSLPVTFSSYRRSDCDGASSSVSLPGGRQARNSPLFETDPLSLQEILMANSNSDLQPRDRRLTSTSRNHNSSVPRHIEVDVVVTPSPSHNQQSIHDEEEEEEFRQVLTSSPTKTKKLGRKSGSRSLDNLCSPDVFSEGGKMCDSSGGRVEGGNIGSTPALNKELSTPTTTKSSGDVAAFWEFKVPRPPKPKREMNRFESWAENIENLLADHCGRDVFTEFLQHEFSAENILFYNDCVRYKKVYPNLTECQRISLAANIFQRYVQNGATDPVNVDFQARSQAEKLLPQPTPDMFDLPLGQVYNLLKFDCYPRFLRSDTYRDYSTGALTLPDYGDTSDSSDQESVKSHKLDGRRRSLLPWNIKNRSKNKAKSKDDSDRLNSDISFIQRTAINQNAESSDTDDSRRQSYKLCRVTLPDNSTTVLPCRPGESLSIVVQRLLEKREFHYAAFEVVNVATGKALDLNLEASEMTAKEIRVEPRSFIGIELPKGWKVGVRANPFRKVAEVLKPILSQHGLKLDHVFVYDIETGERIDIKMPMARLDGHNLLVKCKDPQLEEITNHVVHDGCLDPSGFDDDDLASTKTGSSQSSSVFRGFLRRSSKYKRKAKLNKQQQQFLQDDPTSHTDNPETKRGPGNNNPSSVDSASRAYNLTKNATSHDENLQPHGNLNLQQHPSSSSSSPLSLVVSSSELKLPDSSRIRKPIYVGQSNADNNNSDLV